MLHLHVIFLMCQARQHLPVRSRLSRHRIGMAGMDCRKTATVHALPSKNNDAPRLRAPPASIRIDYNHVSEIMTGTMKPPVFLRLYFGSATPGRTVLSQFCDRSGPRIGDAPVTDRRRHRTVTAEDPAER
ncbi:hypothetical protein AA12717_0101 [Gluconacetobacter sacchari DSM 12717]|uniref:Secreted protein n=1 Tax=Gluconacetobacter sacchari DSM 12717 TaxID=1307940 RepID=A0ABQ0P289_9PROT|nr:hypothetical protein AA12717_0101 [Gluconacetobacter sacchari DSM 12717]